MFLKDLSRSTITILKTLKKFVKHLKLKTLNLGKQNQEMWITINYQDWIMLRNLNPRLSVLPHSCRKVIHQSPKSPSYQEDQVEQVEKEQTNQLKERPLLKRLMRDNFRGLIQRIKMLEDRDQAMDKSAQLQCRIHIWMMMQATQRSIRVSYRIR